MRRQRFNRCYDSKYSPLAPSANLNLINFPAAAHWKRPIVKLRSLLDPFTASLHQTQQCVALPGTCSTCCHHR